MHHTEHDGLTEYEQWIVEELVKYGTEDTDHLTNYCFERQYRLLSIIHISEPTRQEAI